MADECYVVKDRTGGSQIKTRDSADALITID